MESTYLAIFSILQKETKKTKQKKKCFHENRKKNNNNLVRGKAFLFRFFSHFNKSENEFGMHAYSLLLPKIASRKIIISYTVQCIRIDLASLFRLVYGLRLPCTLWCVCVSVFVSCLPKK